MSTFTGTNASETIKPGTVSPTVVVIGSPSTPSDDVDIINAGGGVDIIESSGGDDVVTGGTGDDVAALGNGNDRFIWNSGEGNDVVEGDADTDTFELNGSILGETIAVTANGTRVAVAVNGGAAGDLNSVENVVINANDGDDTISATGNLSALTKLTVDGGDGNDTILGSNGVDLLFGGNDNDFIDGQQGNDVGFLGNGDDTFRWDPGDGNDTVEGEAGADTLLFNGSGASENIAISANGDRVLFTRDIANVAMDLNDVETVDYNALGGVDNIVVNDLSGTDVTRVNIDLASTIGGSTGDGAADTVVINGTNGDDVITLTLVNGDLVVSGLASEVVIENFEAGSDSVRIEGLGGDDVIDASALGAGTPLIVLDGGAADDILLGGAGGDVLTGDDGDDIVIGNAGSDLIDSGGGENLEFQDGVGAAPTSSIVSRFGNDNANTITVSRDAAGNILADGIAIPGANVANTALIRLFGNAGDDTITLNETNGALPAAALYGGAGLDALTGGAGGDVLFGQAGNDNLQGKGGFDFLFGGSGNDTLTGGDADDLMFGGAGDDRAIWNPGDDTDLFEGGSGNDTAEVNGGSGDEVFTVTANGTRVRFDRLDPSPFSLDLGSTENVVVNMNGGNDTFSATGNLAALTKITVDGGDGNDTILGSNGIDLLLGGNDNDFIDGQQGNDTAFLGSGDDVFQWDPGDGSDVVEGQDGVDTLLFNGSGGDEIVTMSANGSRVLFTRNLGNIVMDLDDVETLDHNALGGVDTITVNDLSGTDVDLVNIDLAGTLGGSTGDGKADTVVINGTNGDDIITLTLVNGDLVVSGLSADVVIENFETTDVVRIQGLGGDDIVDASAIGAGGPTIVLDGGGDDDILLGSAGADQLLGGDGDDNLIGNAGADTLDGGTGDNVVIQDQAGGAPSLGIVSLFGDGAGNPMTVSRDAAGNLLFNGAAIPGANVANTALVRLFGNAGDDTITLNETNGALPAAALYGGAGLDALTGGAGGDMLFGGDDNDNLQGKGGFDFLFGGSGNDTLTGGDADDLMFGGGGDDRIIWNPGDDTDLAEGGSGIDTVEVNGGGGDEVFTITANGTRVRFDRLDPAPFSIDIGTSEKLVVNMNGGNDTFSATGNLAALIGITVDGGAGNDTILGSNGIDLLLGGDDNDFIDGQQGNDTAFLGSGNDTFQWDPGDGSDIVEGQDGVDTLLFNGSGGDEIVTMSANGSRVLFTRNLGNIVMDLDDVETLDHNALGGVDTITVNDLSGTDVDLVNIDLAGTLGGSTGDGKADTVIVNGTNGDDIIMLTLGSGGLTIDGLSADVVVEHFELTDTVRIQGLGGNDVFDLTAIAAGGPFLFVEGGAGDDVYKISSSFPNLIEGVDAGIDTVESSITHTLGANIENLTLTGAAAISGGGNDLANVMIGNSAANLLSSAGGDDLLDGGRGGDAMTGGTGDDTYIVDNAGDSTGEQAGGGTDTVESSISLSLAAHVENLVLTGAAAITGIGNELANVMTGNSAANTLLGLNGNDRLDGQGGADVMEGGIGDDTYVVDNAGDTTVESEDAGTDTVQSSVSLTLAANIENLVLSGSTAINGAGNSLANAISGNSAANVLSGGGENDILTGFGGNDRLDGGAGVDAMAGGNGNDTYMVDDAGDTAIEASGSDVDTVQSTVTFTLAGGIENLVLNGTAAINGIGNGLANTISGNSAANVLNGADGADILNAFGGNDTLNGGTGADGMTGGLGDDTYIVDNAGDTTVEASGGGIDIVQSSLSHTLAAQVENLRLTGASAIDGAGNGLANVITGNSAANTLSGFAGNDRLDGGGGADGMSGGLGDDTYVVDNAGDAVVEQGSSGTDTVQSAVSFALSASVENLILNGTAAIDGSGNVLANAMTGNSAANRLTGNAGNDTLTGFGGADVFVFDDGHGVDTVTDFQNGVDLLDLAAVGGVGEFDDLVITDTGPGVLVDYGTGRVLLANVANVGDVDASDFIFAS